MRFLRAMALIGTLAVSACASGPGRGSGLPEDAFLREAALAQRPADDLGRLAHDIVMGRAGAAERLEAQLRTGAGSRDAQVEGWAMLCAERFRRTQWAAAASTCGRAEAMQAGTADSILQLIAGMEGEPPLEWSVPGLVVAMHDTRIEVGRGADALQAIVDTGAEVAVVTESAARRLGARNVGSGVRVGTTTTPVAGGTVVFDRLAVGGAELRHLHALVLPDEALAMAGVQMILSLPALTCAGRVAFLEHGTKLAIGDAAPAMGAASAPLYWDESGLGVGVDFAGGRRGAHLDTGSNRTWLNPATIAVLSEAERATREPRKLRYAGLGGATEEDGFGYRNVTLRIGGEAWAFDDIEMYAHDENGQAGQIGYPIMQRFATIVLDFRTMRMGVAG